MTNTTPSSNDSTLSTSKTRRFSLNRLFHGNGKHCVVVESTDPSVPAVPPIPAHYRHSMAPSMDAIQSQMMRERRRSIAAMSDSNTRATSLDLNHHTVEMTEKMRQFDELLQKRRGSTIRISLTPSLLQESS
ncbi:hypothetical protein EMPS_09161 [Entomortierella parvispora]|uniref:Uncharacterized protein n=1 Tax=Entomortierella parvispora TaxID=205924 RepID=A0A9P3HI96_9FUNG|nr:hypothetical protein EMPS_09161 [Entomortierella parvispora]